MAESLADRFCITLAKIKALDPDNEDPKRHDIRRLRYLAENILDDAIRKAWEAADIAERLRE